MVYGPDPITKKNPKKTMIKHQPGSHIEDLMKGEFYNCALKRSLLLSHEWTTKKLLFRLITG
jgi:hypothetical protein